MRYRISAGVAAAVLAAAPGWTQEAGVERVTRGNLVMEGIPEIPAEVSERLRQYRSTRSAGFSDWAWDGGVLVSTRFGETTQIHHVAEPGGARRQLTFFDEPIGGASTHPGAEAFAFGRDAGGDEFWQIYVQDADSGQVVQITEPGTRNGAGVWSDDGLSMAYYRSTADDPDWDVMLATSGETEGTLGDPDAGVALQVILEGEGAMTPVDFSDDGSRLLLSRYVSILRSQRYVLDVASGELTEINPDAEYAYFGGEFTPDGEHVILVTDGGGEYRRLARMAVADGAIEFISPEIEWDVAGFDVSADGATAVYATNAGGLSEIFLVDLASGDVSAGPDLPAGVVYGLTFNADGDQVGFTFNGAANAADAWSFDVAERTLTRWTESEVGGLNPDGFVEPELISYPTFDEVDGAPRQIPAFVYRPTSEGPHPVIIDIHGGPESQERPTFSSTIQYWVNELGVAVVAPNVRGSSGYGRDYVALDNGMLREDSVRDIGALLDWVALQPDLDADRVIVYGGSYGGYMVLASMVNYGDRLAGGVNIVGISSFVTFLENTMGYRRDLRRVEYGDERDPEMRAFLETISPLNNVERINRPLFIIQGANDPRVPASEAEQILAAVRENGGDPWFLMAMDEGHGFRKQSNRVFMSEAVTMFLRDTLGLEGAG